MLELQFLQFFTCVSSGILASINLIDRADNSYTSLRFFFLLFSIFLHSGIQKPVHISSFCPFVCSFLLSISFILLFSFAFLFAFCSVLLSVYSHYFLISLTVFFSNLLSFLFFFPITLFCLFLLYVL